MATVSDALARLFSDKVKEIYAAPSKECLRELARNTAQLLQSYHEAPAAPHTDGVRLVRELLDIHVQRRERQFDEPSPKTIRSGETQTKDLSIFKLTARETEVLRHIALGETDRTIAQALGISAKTVGKHVEHILHKIGVETRTAAAMYFQ